jgi:pimeloyl-ACP methyl ester carboxylesterase
VDRVDSSPGVRPRGLTAGDLDVLRLGSGPPVLLVHGSVVDASRTWRHQLVLAEHWSLRLPNRPGFAGSPALPRGDFEAEAPLIADLLGDGAHLVGHSYGAVIALLAAALRPEAVRSLTISEPGALEVARGHPGVAEVIAHGEELFRSGRASGMTPREFLIMFRAGVHSSHETPDPLPDWLERGARLLMEERPPWQAKVPLEQLARTEFPKLVISGAHSPVFEAVCDVCAQRLGARRAMIAGRGHTIPGTGAAYNRCLHDFLAATEAQGTRASTSPREAPAPE